MMNLPVRKLEREQRKQGDKLDQSHSLMLYALRAKKKAFLLWWYRIALPEGIEGLAPIGRLLSSKTYCLLIPSDIR